MTPVTQTEFNAGTGNCFAACVASILGLSVAEVPNFCQVDQPGEQTWLERFADWLESRGMGFILMPGGPQAGYIVDGLWGIASGPSPRYQGDGDDFLHAVVVQAKHWVGHPQKRNEAGELLWHWGLEFVHDPHPSCDFLRDGQVVDTVWIVPRDMRALGCQGTFSQTGHSQK